MWQPSFYVTTQTEIKEFGLKVQMKHQRDKIFIREHFLRSKVTYFFRCALKSMSTVVDSSQRSHNRVVCVQTLTITKKLRRWALKSKKHYNNKDKQMRQSHKNNALSDIRFLQYVFDIQRIFNATRDQFHQLVYPQLLRPQIAKAQKSCLS